MIWIFRMCLIHVEFGLLISHIRLYMFAFQSYSFAAPFDYRQKTLCKIQACTVSYFHIKRYLLKQYSLFRWNGLVMKDNILFLFIEKLSKFEFCILTGFPLTVEIMSATIFLKGGNSNKQKIPIPFLLMSKISFHEVNSICLTRWNIHITYSSKKEIAYYTCSPYLLFTLLYKKIYIKFRYTVRVTVYTLCK